jgi:imidazoleglycerol-phosphate dehydratase
MKKRTASKHRVTKETDIDLSLNLDGQGRYDISTTLPFLDHMLELFSKQIGRAHV